MMFVMAVNKVSSGILHLVDVRKQNRFILVSRRQMRNLPCSTIICKFHL